MIFWQLPFLDKINFINFNTISFDHVLQNSFLNLHIFLPTVVLNSMLFICLYVRLSPVLLKFCSEFLFAQMSEQCTTCFVLVVSVRFYIKVYDPLQFFFWKGKWYEYSFILLQVVSNFTSTICWRLYHFPTTYILLLCQN